MHLSGTKHCVSSSPASPLALQLALPNRLLVGGVCIALPLYALKALSCAPILLCDLNRSAAKSVRSPPDCVSWRGPSHVASQGQFNFFGITIALLKCQADFFLVNPFVRKQEILAGCLQNTAV